MLSGYKDDYTDVWMIEITIKTNQIDMDVCIFQKYITSTNHVCPFSLAFPISLLVYEFNPLRQTWYQKFLGTYLSLVTKRKHQTSSQLTKPNQSKSYFNPILDGVFGHPILDGGGGRQKTPP